MVTYKGLVVPPKARAPENKEALREALERIEGECPRSSGECFVIEAASCEDLKGDNCGSIDCDRCICDRKHIGRFREYLDSSTGLAPAPEPKPGDVLLTDGGVYLLYAGACGAYSLSFARYSGAPQLGSWYPSLNARAIERIYRPAKGGFSVSDLISILVDGAKYVPFWKRPEPVKEMTVDEISKALGYKVKVVGNEKTDD